MSFTIRPAVRAKMPLIVGLAGPTKSGKTMSAHRLAKGMAEGGKVVMINTEGAKGHLYAERFEYLALDLPAPFNPERYTEAVAQAAKENPAVLIIDSASHMHDGPGGILEYHETEIDKRLKENKDDWKARERMTFTGWIKPKAAENEFIYKLLGLDCHVILAFRAKEKLRIVKGKEPENLGWQPIAGDRVTFETMFTLILPPFSKGVPDLAHSEMRSPFDKLIPVDKAIDETLGARLAEWARGGVSPVTPSPARTNSGVDAPVTSQAGAPPVQSSADPISNFWREVRGMGMGRPEVMKATDGVEVDQLEPDALAEILERLKAVAV